MTPYRSLAPAHPAATVRINNGQRRIPGRRPSRRTLVPGRRRSAVDNRSESHYRLDGVNLLDRLVVAVPQYPCEAQRHAARVAGGALDTVDGDLGHQWRL